MSQVPPADNSDLRAKTLKGAGWSVAAKMFRQFFQLLFQILLARMLLPADFGLLSMTLVFSALADILRNLGLGSAIIQRTDVKSIHLNTAFWMNVMAATIIFILFQFFAPLIARFYKTPALEDITRVYAFVYLVGSLNVVQEAIMQKELQFKRLFKVEAVAVLTGGILALVLAYLGYGVWTLVFQYLCITVVSTVMLWFTSAWRPDLAFSRNSLSELGKFGRNLIANDLLSFVSRNIDNLVIGRYLGSSVLGIYSRAYFLMLQPMNITSQVLARVMFPVFASMQHDLGYIRQVYLRSTRLVAFIVFPGIIYVMVMAHPIIRVMLGNNWLEVAYILQIFCIYSLIDTIGVSSSWIYKSLGRTDTMFRWSIYSTIIIIASIVFGLQWGIEGIAISYVASFLVFLWIPGWYIAFRLIHLRVGSMLQNLLPPFSNAVFAGGFMFGINYLISGSLPDWLMCLLVFVAGMFFYLSLSFFLDKSSLLFYGRTSRKLINRVTRRLNKKVQNA